MTKNLLDGSSGPELFFGLIGPVGTDLQVVSEILDQELKNVGYESSEIRLSALLRACAKYKDLAPFGTGPEDERIDAHMNAGNDLRATMQRGDAVALLAVSAIRQKRQELSGTANQAVAKRAYVLNSLKHPGEIEALRRIYGAALFVISVYSPRDERVEKLSDTIAKSRQPSDRTRFRAHAEKLVEKDAQEVGDRYGQNVREAFPHADVFIQSEPEVLRRQICRFVQLLFGHPFHTPTKEELAMFQARAASLQSADLSRQVGVVIAADDGSILSTGCNEVPKPGGGQYWSGDDPDYRDFKLGRDANAEFKHELMAEVLKELKDAGWLAEAKAKLSPQQLADEALYGEGNGPLQNSRVANIIEFGRIVHAEMSAITRAAQRGTSIQGSTLYSTTFPCHMCARHILAAGIGRVVYIEPYPKSLAKDLYRKQISVEGDAADDGAVRFDSFVGIAPRRFLDLFSMPKRKDRDGKVLPWRPAGAVPRVRRFAPVYLDVETSIGNFLADNLVEFGIAENGGA